MVRVMFGWSTDDRDEWEGINDHFSEDMAKNASVKFSEDDEAFHVEVEFTFEMSRSDAVKLYTLLQMFAGLDMPLQPPDTDMGLFIDGVRYG